MLTILFNWIRRKKTVSKSHSTASALLKSTNIVGAGSVNFKPLTSAGSGISYAPLDLPPGRHDLADIRYQNRRILTLGGWGVDQPMPVSWDACQRPLSEFSLPFTAPNVELGYQLPQRLRFGDGWSHNISERRRRQAEGKTREMPRAPLVEPVVTAVVHNPMPVAVVEPEAPPLVGVEVTPPANFNVNPRVRRRRH